MSDTIQVTAPADFHVHLRQGAMAEVVTKHVRQGGFTLAYVMARPPLALSLLQMARLISADVPRSPT